MSPLSMWGISLWLAATSIILLITSELLAPYYTKIGVPINRKRLKNTVLTLTTLFLATVAIRVISIILGT
jgi:hypothetical protein